jgi:hypothetical protein
MQLVQPPADVNPHRGHRPENPSSLVACPHIEGKVRHPFFKGIREDYCRSNKRERVIVLLAL